MDWMCPNCRVPNEDCDTRCSTCARVREQLTDYHGYHDELED